MNEYASWYTEIHPYEVGFEVTRKIAAHLAVRVTAGSAIIVCDRPRNMLSTFSKRWNHVLRLVENQTAATTGNIAKGELKVYQLILEGTHFMIGEPDERVTPTVWLIEPDDLNKVPRGIMTIYVMSDLSLPQLLFWARQMGDGSAVVVFRKEPLAAAPQAK